MLISFLQLFFISNNNILSIVSTRTFLAYETKTNCYFKEKAHILELYGKMFKNGNDVIYYTISLVFPHFLNSVM